MSEANTRSYTVRLELVDEPGELLRALEPIADNGGNLLSIFHERGKRHTAGTHPRRGRPRGDGDAVRDRRRRAP